MKGKSRYDYIISQQQEGYTQKEIAIQLEISYQTLKNWFNQNRAKYEQQVKNEQPNEKIKVVEQIDVPSISQDQIDDDDDWKIFEYWLNIRQTLIFLTYEPLTNPFKDDLGILLWDLNFDLEFYFYSFWEVHIFEFEESEPKDNWNYWFSHLTEIVQERQPGYLKALEARGKFTEPPNLHPTPPYKNMGIVYESERLEKLWNQLPLTTRLKTDCYQWYFVNFVRTELDHINPEELHNFLESEPETIPNSHLWK